MKSAWKNQWSVGNAIIDSEHRNLLDMAYNLGSIIRKGDISAISQELEQLENWLCEHFKNEEDIALSVGFDFTRHGLEHQNLLKEFQLMKDGLMFYCDMPHDATVKQYFKFLDEWLISHILNEDILMKPTLQTHSYGFMPGHKTKSEIPLLAKT